jgi:peptide/nickel transport system substrate-binding protein
MLRNRIRPLVFLVTLVGLLAPGWVAAQSSPVQGGSLRVAITGDPPTLDPHTSTAVIVLEITSHVAEGLYARDGEGAVRPMLAEALPEVSDDGLTYTIRLRQGVTFHDGQVLDADDVVASLERWRRIGSGKNTLGKAESIVAVDASTVRIQLTEPVGILTSVLGWTEGAAVIYPATLVESAGDDPIDAPIGTGPYRLKEWVKGQRVVLERFDGYVGRTEEPSGDFGRKNAWLDEIHFIAVPDAATRQAGLESGEFDVNYRAAASDLEYIESSDAMYPWLMRPGYNYIALINHRSETMQDPKLRQALQAALDIYPLVLGAFGNDAVFSLSSSIVPQEYGAMHDGAAGAELYDQGDLERAKALLAESNYDGRPIRWLTSRDYDYQYRGTLIAVDQVSQAGVDSEIIVRDWATTVSIRSDPSAWDIFIGNFTIAPEPEMIPYINPNYLNGYEGSERYQELRAQLAATTDVAERQRIWSEAQAAFYEDVGAIQMANTFLLNAYASDVHVEARYFLFQAWNTWKD